MIEQSVRYLTKTNDISKQQFRAVKLRATRVHYFAKILRRTTDQNSFIKVIKHWERQMILSFADMKIREF